MQLSERLFTPGSEHTNELVTKIQRKHELLEAGDPAHADIKTALIIGAGAMRGVYSGGVVTGLEELGLTEVFDDVIGVSVGASTAAYFLAGQARVGTTLFSEELTSKEFIDLTRFSNVLNVGFLEKIFTTGNKILDQDAIRQNRSRFHIGVTNIETAKPEYIEVSHTKDKDIIKLIQASSSVPGLAPPVVVDGVVYGDGITTCKNPIGYAVETLGATDIICIVNQPLRDHKSTPVSDKAISAMLTRGYSESIRAAYRARHEGSDETADTSYGADVHIGILCPDDKPIGRLTKNAKRLIQIAEQAEQQTKTVLG